MAQRFYLADIIGGGMSVTDAFRPAIADLLPALGWASADLRAAGSPSGRMFVWATVSDADHATLAADSRITVIPLQNAQGGALDVSAATLGDVPAAARSALASRLDAAGVPTGDFTLATPLRQVVARVVRRALMRQALGGDDFTEALSTLVGALSAQRRSAIATVLQAKGYDTSVILGTDTIGEALQKLLVQSIGFQTTPWG